jgi:1-acyl-sn-glycerol-3-phosphate acyltransferase
MRVVARLVVWIQIGRVRTTGLANIESAEPKIILPTHGHYLDPFVLAHLLPEGARIMAAHGLLRFGGGLGALLFSKWGAFCTDLDEGKGIPALRAAVRILVSGQTLVMFPEGWAHMDGAVGPFRQGAAGIARMAEAKLHRPVAVVPVYLRYGRYPGPWINRFSTTFQCLILFAGIIFFRRGVCVSVGKPVLSCELSKDNTLATETLRRAVLDLGESPGVPLNRNPRGRESSSISNEIEKLR